MFKIDTWEEIFSILRKNKLRTFLTAFSVSWGIFMLIVLIGAGNGLQNGVQATMNDDASNSIWIYSGKTSVPYQGLPIGRQVKFTNKDYTLLRERVEGVEYLTGRFYLWGEFAISYRDKSSAFSVRSCHPDHKYLENTIITQGRFINEKDIKEERKVTAIGKDIVVTLFGDEDPIGKYIKVNDLLYKVVGVYKDEGGINENRIVYIPITTAQKAYAGEDRIHQMMLTTGTKPFKETIKMAGNIERLLSRKHKVAPGDKRGLSVYNNNEDFRMMQNVFTGIELFMWCVGIFTIIAGIVGITNIMLISVKERTREIGIRKAMGATTNSIIWLIILESVFITFFSGYFGMMAGIGVLELVNFVLPDDTNFFRNPEVQVYVPVAAFILLLIAGVLAGYFPARKAASVDPVVALRDE
ncbi:MAG: ABC transporter permease [Chitinophagales bacterium]|nr:ABC transporter permease [Chitinophagales bacterium]